ncbi:uncharacterized protein ACR2FA_002742 [Aphomia sociella]
MSDSENDFLPNNVFTYQNENTTFSARGPNINATNLTGLSFRNNVLTSTMNMSRRFDNQRHLEPKIDYRSNYYRRDVSPTMSLRSASDFRSHNFQQSHYPRGMSSQRSMFNGRSGSPMSVRSIDTTTSVSAADIALAFKNMNFNKYDMRIIKEAYNKFMKRRIRKKIEKRRNLKLFMKGYRRKSGYDSGELGSDSSISSDDCRSTSTALYKDNISSCRSTRTDVTDFRRTIRENNMYKDCTDRFKQNVFRNMLPVGSDNIVKPMEDKAPNNYPPSVDAISQQITNMRHSPIKQNINKGHAAITQKNRFQTACLLPSQRFNPPIASTSSTQHLKVDAVKTNGAEDIDSDQEEIFSEITIREKSINNVKSIQNEKIIDQRKRCLDIDDAQTSSSKRNKAISSSHQFEHKQNHETEVSRDKKQKENTNDFEFIKPQFPVRKSGHSKVKEVLLAKSAQPLLNSSIVVQNVKEQVTKPLPEVESVEEERKEQNGNGKSELSLSQLSTSDVSMRPSFIKRKLYTQKHDLMDNKNVSSENLVANSPQGNVYSAIQKERHKTRKLVTNQSCLNRDVLHEDNNLLDLIHKIVPPDRINTTNVTNKTDNANNRNSQDEDKWDVTSVISTCNNDDVSDTYTDEEIFQADNKSKVKKNETKGKIENIKRNKVYKCVKSFWDTDFESDLENVEDKKSDIKENNLSANTNEKKTKSIIKSNSILKVNNHLEKLPVLNNKSIVRTRQSPKVLKCCIEPAVSKHVTKDINKTAPELKPKQNNNVPTKNKASDTNKLRPNSKKITLEVNSSSNETPESKIIKKKYSKLHPNLSLNSFNSSLNSTSENIINRSSLRARKPKVTKNKLNENKIEKPKQNECETTFRTLRSRKIDLSSSFSDKSLSIDEKNVQQAKSRKKTTVTKKVVP